MMLTYPPHIVADENGLLWIDDSGYRVLDLVREHLAHGWSAEVLQENHPDLTLGQIHAALSSFYDNEQEMRREMAHREEVAHEVFAQYGESPAQQRLRRIKAGPR